MGYLVERHHRALPVDVPDRVRADRPEDALRRRRSTSGSPPTRARAGSGSARTSRGTTRRRWGRRAGRSRSIRPASRPTRRSSRSRRRAVDGNVIWAGSDDGLVHVTRDGGKNWDEGHAAGPAGVRAHQPDRSVAARCRHGVPRGNRYQRADRAPYVYKTADYGKTWTKIVSGLPGDDFARAIREDTKRKGLLFLGTETGIYVSFDDGGDVAVAAARPAGDAGARHRVKGQRPASSARTAASFYVHGQHRRPAAVHARDDRRAGRACSSRPTRCGRCRAASPIDYYLKAAADKVTIEILDAQGQVGAHLHRRAAEGRRRDSRAGAAERRGRRSRPPPPRVAVKAGHEPLRVGHALSGRDGLSRADHVGRQHARARRRRRDATR